MSTDEQLKTIVKEKYGTIAKQTTQGCCCDCSCSDNTGSFCEDYSTQEGYVASADLGLGCGIPTEFTEIKKGDTVLDLGSGAGNDAFVARSFVGVNGTVIGVDFTEEMIAKAKENQAKMGYQNVEFRLGEIENLPIEENEIDTIVSNCVLNLVPDKDKAFEEMYRVLKPGGQFCVSDIVLNGELPEKLKSIAELYAGCVSGATQKDDYLNKLSNVGFVDVEVKKERNYNLSEEYLNTLLSEDEVKKYMGNGSSILSVTVFGKKPIT